MPLLIQHLGVGGNVPHEEQYVAARFGEVAPVRPMQRRSCRFEQERIALVRLVQDRVEQFRLVRELFEGPEQPSRRIPHVRILREAPFVVWQSVDESRQARIVEPG